MDILTLEWKNAAIGTISAMQIDMWYIEAVFTSNKTEHAANFEKLASKLKLEETYADPLKGMMISMKGLESITDCLVLSLSGNEIFLRIITGEAGKKNIF
jgi:hypothetical protein